ncbi:MAG TPA: hypothetical protein VJ717_07390 [Gemmatimonadaceae bacterium]|nr:hypothetical protein [Gemmatimonadaceae bacterium]
MLRLTVLVALFGLAACGGSGSAPAASAPAPASEAQRRDPNLITRAEIDQATWANNAFDLVQRLRPAFLRIGGPTNWSGAAQTPLVRLNEQELGDHGALRQIAVGAIEEIRFYSAPDATAKFGGTRGRPVIAVKSR